MSQRAKRYAELFPSDRERVLAVLATGRQSISDTLRKLNPTSPTYQRSLAIIRAIDDLAEVLTGDRAHFGLKPHGGNYNPGAPGR